MKCKFKWCVLLSAFRFCFFCFLFFLIRYLFDLSTWPLRQAFLTQLVCHLLDEGNACYRDGDWRQASQQYSEGISVARYAQAEALVIPHELLESLYVNRAAAYYQTVRGSTENDVYQLDLMFRNNWSCLTFR